MTITSSDGYWQWDDEANDWVPAPIRPVTVAAAPAPTATIGGPANRDADGLPELIEAIPDEYVRMATGTISYVAQVIKATFGRLGITNTFVPVVIVAAVAAYGSLAYATSRWDLPGFTAPQAAEVGQ